MSWLRLALDCDGTQVPALSELLQRLGAEAVSVERAGGPELLLAADERAAYWERSRISALLPADADLDIVIACLRQCAAPSALSNPAVERVADRDWVAIGRAAHGPLLFGGRLCICPSWAEAPAAAPLPTLVLDPGLAFGTGAHPTTALCLEQLAARPPQDGEVIDYGCGSGVLGLAAALLGARRVTAVDVDAQARAATRANAARNGMADRVRAQAPELPLPAPADLLLANILLAPLLELAPRFAALTRPGGSILLSGLLATQADACAAAYRPWFELEPALFRDEWALLAGRRLAGTD